jgi:DNA-binding beta-propeller fold protein YncE
MKRVCGIFLAITVIAVLTATVVAQESFPSRAVPPLLLVRTIPLPGVEGRFDHMALDPKGARLFATVYGNDTVEVIDLRRSKRVHSIEGLNEPQGVAYVPESNQIVVSNAGDGLCKVYDAASFNLIKTVNFPSDSDQLRYDPATRRVYVGYGDGAIGAIDVTKNERVGDDFEVGAHPESFQLETSGPRIFVNLQSINQIAVINRKTRQVAKWKLTEAGTNFPMALDEPHRRMFIGARRPGRLLVYDMDSGKVVASLPSASDTDDLWFDPDRKRIYVPGGEGFIYVFQQIDADHYQPIAKIPTAVGARVSFYSSETVGKHNDLYLAVPSHGNLQAEMWVYETVDE